mgnify:CR=1 FL=1
MIFFAFLKDKLPEYYTSRFKNTAQILKIIKAHTSPIISLDFHPTDEKFITGGRDHKAIEWSFRGEKLNVFNHTSRCFHSVLYSKDGKNILTGSCDGTLTSINLESRKQIYSIKEKKSNNCFQIFYLY